jgi:hypothetical protein
MARSLQEIAVHLGVHDDRAASQKLRLVITEGVDESRNDNVLVNSAVGVGAVRSLYSRVGLVERVRRQVELQQPVSLSMYSAARRAICVEISPTGSALETNSDVSRTSKAPPPRTTVALSEPVVILPGVIAVPSVMITKGRDALPEGNLELRTRRTQRKGSINLNEVGISQNQLVGELRADLVSKYFGVDDIANLCNCHLMGS